MKPEEHIQEVPLVPPPPEVVIDIRDLHRGFGNRRVLQGVNLRVKRGRSVVVLGGSGTGKSVLIKHIVKLLTPDRGEVWVLGKRVDLLEGDELDRLRLSIGYLFQSGALFDSMTIYENMDFILERHTSLSREERKSRIIETLRWVNLEHTVYQYPAELSGGQRKRAALARAIILEPSVMLYDEPTTGLDPISVRTVSYLIRRLQRERGVTSIAITHDLLCARIITDEAHFLYGGKLVAHGTLDEVRKSNHPAVREFFGDDINDLL